MKNYLRWVLYSLGILAQLTVPFLMIHDSETILKTGTRYQFRTAPVDPVDAFRGKYITLAFSANSCAVDSPEQFKVRQKVYAAIKADSDGFAQITHLTKQKPRNDDYVKVTVIYPNGHKVQIEYPFNKYFLNENQAPQAERLYREHNLNGKQDAYVVVRIKNGRAVIEDLFVGGLPLGKSLQMLKMK